MSLLNKLVPALLLVVMITGCGSSKLQQTAEAASTTPAPVLRAMTYNIYYGGVPGYRYETVNTVPFLNSDVDGVLLGVKAAKADIVCIQEKLNEWNEEHVGPNIAELVAKRLGWYFIDQQQVDGAWGDVAFISKYPIVKSEVTASGLGVMIDVPEVGHVMVFNIHGFSYPYQPYQLNDIEYKNAPFIKTEAEAIHFANEARGALGTLVANEIKQLPADLPIIVMGDHNEPSGDDWTERAAQAGIHPIAVDYPLTATWKKLGLKDSYRTVHPDEIAFPGVSWRTNGTVADVGEHDRIDFIFVRELADRFEIVNSELVGCSEAADIFVDDGRWVSDHNAFVTTIKLGKKN